MGEIQNLDFFNKAKEFAVRKHKGQLRKSGEPYCGHPIRVANIILKYKDSNEMDDLLVAALLHDVLEDTDTGISELRENFGEVATLLVVELTSDQLRAKMVGKARYLSDKFSSERNISNWALVIKLADRLDNVSDLNERDVGFAKKMKAQTASFLDVLEEKRKLTRTHKKLIGAIREKLEGVEI